MKIVALVLIVLLVPAMVFATGIPPVVPVVVAGGASSTNPLWVFVGMQVGVLAILSPWLIMYYENEDCRDKTNIGDMAKCVQKKGR